MGFVHLHAHSSLGSRLDGVSSSEDYVKKAVSYNHKALAITDHGRLNGIYEHQTQCLKYDIKPIIGMEMYLSDNLEMFEKKRGKGKRIRTKNYHIILLVKNEIGYKNLLYLNYLSMKDTTHFYYLPRITQKELFANSEGLIIGTACIVNPFCSLLRAGKQDEAISLFQKYVEVFKEDFYVELQLNELINEMDDLQYGQKTSNDFMIMMANKFGIPIVLTGDIHYTEKGQDKLQTLSIAIRNKNTIDNITFELESKELYYHNVNDYIEFNERWKYGYSKKNILEWCRNTEIVADKCNFLIPLRKRLHLPQMTDDDDKNLIVEGRKGLMLRLGIDNYSEIPEEYKKRLEHELKILIRKGFSSYCLICKDISDFSLENGIYGRIGRGSASGSILLWALNIHNFDSIKHGLLFERFMSKDRSPDLVVDYLAKDI